MYFKVTKIDQDKAKAVIPENIVLQQNEELWKEYCQKYGEIAETFCTQKLLDKGYARSIGQPAQYSYINEGCKLSFIMKYISSAKIHYENLESIKVYYS